MLRVKMVRVGTVKPRAMYIAENSATGQAETLNGRACWGSEPGVRDALESAGYCANGDVWEPAILKCACGKPRGVTLKRMSLG